MGGVGIAFGYGFSLLLSIVGLQTLFLIVSILMVLALLVLLWKVKEKESYTYKAILLKEEESGQKVKTKGGPGIIESFKSVIQQKDTSLIFVLLAIFFWFITYQGILSLITLYGTNVLGYDAGLAGFLPFIVTVPFLITIIPLSYLANKIGRRNAIKIGLMLWIAMLILAYFFGILGIHDLGIMAIPLAVLGIGWALINTNSIVIVWELAPTEKEIGAYTGIYYFSSFLASILGPMIIGFMTDIFGWPSMVLNGVYFFIVALIIMFFVKRGEVELTDEEKAARQKAIQELRSE
jgi:MFS family permease